MNPHIAGYTPPTQPGDGRPTLQIDTNPLHPSYPVPPYGRGQVRPVYPAPQPNPGDPVALETNSPSSISPTPASSASVTQPDDASPRRKRSRVTPEQLARLEELFSSDRSPTVSRRKEISAELGMGERQTQIWFQNRRAKAKVQEGKGKPRTKKAAGNKGRKSGFMSPDTSGHDLSPDDDYDETGDTRSRPPPAGTPHYERYVARRFGEQGPITVIPCQVLKIGNWPTISDPSRGRELVAFVAQRSTGPTLVMVWFFSDGGKSYKLELPVSSIESTRVNLAGTRPDDPYPLATARLRLSRPPEFYLLSAPPGTHLATLTSSVNQSLQSWTPCPDFTQGGTGTPAQVYEMQGPAHTMVRALQNFPNYTQDGGLSSIAGSRPGTQASGPRSGMTLPTLPSLANDATGPYSIYPPGASSHAIQTDARSFSGGNPSIYPPYVHQQSSPRQTPYLQAGNPPMFAFEAHSSIAQHNFASSVPPLSDRGTSQSSAAEYSAPSSRTFTAETLSTPFFPNLSSPAFQEAAQSLMNDEHGSQTYPTYIQQTQCPPPNAAPLPDSRISPAHAYHVPTSYTTTYGASGPSAPSTLTQQYQISYVGHRPASQQALEPPRSSHGYAGNPPP